MPQVPSSLSWSNKSSTVTSGVSAPNVSRKYQGLIDANPYRNAEYTKTPWQNFLSALGIRTQADAWKENMSVQAAEYDAAILQKQYDEEYNDPTNQVQRMREAGLNPDINGGDSIDSGSAQPLGEDPSTPMQSSGDEGLIMDAANSIMSAVSTGFAIAKDIGSLKNLHIMNDQGNLETGERVAKFAKWITDQNLITQQGRSYDDFKDHISFASKDSYKIHSSSVPAKFRKQFKRNLDTFYSSLDYATKSLEAQKSKNQGMKDLAQQTISKFFGGSDLETWQIVNDGLVRLSDLAEEYSLRALKNQNHFKSDYYGSLDGSDIGKAETQSAKYNEQILGTEAQSAGIQKEINSVMKDIVHSLKVQADKGDFFAQSMLLSFSLARMANVSVGPTGVKFGFSGNF